MFEYHEKEKQIKFLKAFDLKTEEEKALMAEIIHDLEEPLQNYCIQEAEHRLNEAACERKGTEPTQAEILSYADLLYNSPTFLDGEFAETEAYRVYDNSMHLIADWFPTNRRHKCYKYSDDTYMIRASVTGWQCWCGMMEDGEDAFNNLLDMDSTPLEIYFPCDNPESVLAANQGKADDVLMQYNLPPETLIANDTVITLSTEDVSHLSEILAALAKIFGFTEEEEL